MGESGYNLQLCNKLQDLTVRNSGKFLNFIIQNQCYFFCLFLCYVLHDLKLQLVFLVLIMAISPFDKPGSSQMSSSIICRSLGSGKRPHTIVNKSTPSDHAVAGFPWYLPSISYSGGKYSAVPEGKT